MSSVKLRPFCLSLNVLTDFTHIILGYFTGILAVTWWMWLTHLPLDKMSAHFPDDIFKCIFLIENGWTLIEISLKFVSYCPIDNKPALV